MLMSGISNGRDSQREMISDLVARRVRWLVLSPGIEGSKSFYQHTKSGDVLFDDWLRARYQTIARFGKYEVRVLN
jgi:hypothetical protein